MAERQFLKVKASRCALCHRCELSCAFVKHGQYDPSFAAIRVEDSMPDNYKVRLRYCIQCKEEECMKACPTKALHRDDKGVVMLNQSLCDSCEGAFTCVKACSKGFIFTNPNVKFPIKCDLCGGQPACVIECPESILTL